VASARSDLRIDQLSRLRMWLGMHLEWFGIEKARSLRSKAATCFLAHSIFERRHHGEPLSAEVRSLPGDARCNTLMPRKLEWRPGKAQQMLGAASADARPTVNDIDTCRWFRFGAAVAQRMTNRCC